MPRGDTPLLHSGGFSFFLAKIPKPILQSAVPSEPKHFITNATVKWISCEPLLGPLESDKIKCVDWVVVGGESGPNCRPMDLNWARKIRDTCNKHDVPFWFKKAGGPDRAKGGKLLDGKIYKQWPKSLSKDMIQKVVQLSLFNVQPVS